uniref:Carbohydrate sulfotransferase n=1 Tax=Eptatretus burgeri TaxID=7764 RepID=A0A8C4Q1P8_EPTBU
MLLTWVETWFVQASAWLQGKNHWNACSQCTMRCRLSSWLKIVGLSVAFLIAFKEILLQEHWEHIQKKLISTLTMDVSKEQERRKAIVHAFCRNTENRHRAYNLSNHNWLKRVFVEDRFQLLYCEIPKVGCTNWRRVLLVLAGHVEGPPDSIKHVAAHGIKKLRPLSSYSNREIKFRLTMYTKFLFVREPFNRLVSAYRDKFEGNNTLYQEIVGRWIIEKFRENPSKEALTMGKGVTFTEFVRFITYYTNYMDRHWFPMYKLCFPCDIHYDFIGKLENINIEAQWFLHHVGTPDTVDYPKRKDTAVSRTDNDITDYYIKQLSPEDRNALFELAKQDYELFDYPKPKL